MMQRTTISLNKEYLHELKLLALKKQQSLSQLVNNAVSSYLQKVDVADNNSEFFDNLKSVKKELKLGKKELGEFIQKGRL